MERDSLEINEQPQVTAYADRVEIRIGHACFVLPFTVFPALKGVPELYLSQVRAEHNRLCWDALDVQYAYESILFPSRYPLRTAYRLEPWKA